MVTKSEVYHKFLHLHNWIQNNFNTSIKTFRSDGGGEFVSNNLKTYFINNGITHQLSCPYTPVQNGVAERKHRHLLDTTRALLFDSHLPYSFWVDALLTSTYLINRLPSRIIHLQTPYSLLYHCEPDYSHLRVLGCSCFPWQQPLAPHKFSPRAPQSVFLGYSPLHKGYQCFNILTGKTIIFRHVAFDETTFPYPHSTETTTQASTTTPNIPTQLLLPTSSIDNPTPLSPSTPNTPTQLSFPLPISNSPSSSPQPVSPPTLPPSLLPSHPMITRLKSGITKYKPTFDLKHSLTQSTDPSTYSQAAKHPHWQQAMQEEFQALQNQGT